MKLKSLIHNVLSLNMPRKIILGLISLITIWGIKTYWYSKPAPVDTIKKVVETEKVEKQAFQKTIKLLGTLTAKHKTVLKAQGSGQLDIFVPTGQEIKKGTLVAQIRNNDIEKNFQLSQKAVELAQKQYQRFKEPHNKGFVSTKELEEKNQELISNQKELNKARIELDNLKFKAPFNSIIGAYKHREGEQLNSGDEVVALYDPSSLSVDLDIPCQSVQSIKQGQTVIVNNKKYQISHLQKMLDKQTHMCPADVDIDCPDCIIGSTIAVKLVVAEKQAISIPFDAIFLSNGKSFVYTVNKGKVEKLPVSIGLRQKQRIEIIDGLKAEQQVVIKGQERIYPGLAVDIRA